MWNSNATNLLVFMVLLSTLLLMVCAGYFVQLLFLSNSSWPRNRLEIQHLRKEGDHEPSGSETKENPESAQHIVRSQKQEQFFAQ
uniref:Uncharacterized protein n=1 Tax=Peromyscus maniculatus bairdii TaxID=230844 RepID=A0A8C8UR00_PERMB